MIDVRDRVTWLLLLVLLSWTVVLAFLLAVVARGRRPSRGGGRG